MRLKNKSALITGGTSGIGLATAKLFIAEGARVAVTGRDDSVFERVKAELGEHALVLKGDVRSIQDMRAIAADVNEQFGGLNVVFANAGWAFPSAVDDIDDKLYDEIMDVNVKGVVFTLQAALPYLREGSSVILNTSFVAQTGKHGISLTAAAKAAVRSLARSWSYEFLDRKIRFNAIAPGVMNTPLITKWGMSDEWVRDRRGRVRRDDSGGPHGQGRGHCLRGALSRQRRVRLRRRHRTGRRWRCVAALSLRFMSATRFVVAAIQSGPARWHSPRGRSARRNHLDRQ